MEATSDEEILRSLYIELADASAAKDPARMRAVLADDYALYHMTGMRQSREAYISSVLDGTLNYFSVEHESIEVDVAADGAHATIRGRSRVEAAVFGGGRHTWRLQQQLEAEKRDGSWLLTESRASTY